MASELFIGLISGTSLDGIDAALVEFKADNQPRLLHAFAYPWPPALEEELRALSQPGGNEIERLGVADAWAGDILAAAANSLCDQANVAPERITAIGSHGQTVRHGPGASHPYTLQIGDPSRIAELTGITTVADFRRRDMAAGGQGAPLVPAFHAAVFRHPAQSRVVLNIGGIANVTILPPEGEAQVSGFDTGPGNRLLDDWIRRHRGLSLDASGAWAASGRVDPSLLETLLTDPYFDKPPPKSTGTEYFNLQWAAARARDIDSHDPVDVQASFAELTALTVTEAIQVHAKDAKRVLVCGGGSHNTHLMDRLAALMPALGIESTTSHGVDADWVEAMAFAWLARETLSGRPGNLPEVTGARSLRVLGAIYHA